MFAKELLNNKDINEIVTKFLSQRFLEINVSK